LSQPSFDILVAEDNPGDYILLHHAMDASQLSPLIQLQHAADGEKTIQILDQLILEHKKLPDLVLLDIKLPKFSGFEVLEYIKKNEKHFPLSVFILSNSAVKKDVETSRNLGADGYFQKPIDFNELIVLCDLIRDGIMNPHPTPSQSVKNHLQTSTLNLLQATG